MGLGYRGLHCLPCSNSVSCNARIGSSDFYDTVSFRSWVYGFGNTRLVIINNFACVLIIDLHADLVYTRTIQCTINHCHDEIIAALVTDYFTGPFELCFGTLYYQVVKVQSIEFKVAHSKAKRGFAFWIGSTFEVIGLESKHYVSFKVRFGRNGSFGRWEGSTTYSITAVRIINYDKSFQVTICICISGYTFLIGY